MLSFKELRRSLKNTQEDLPVIRAALLGDTATQLLAEALRGTAVSRGYGMELFEAEYNQIEQQVFNPQSEYWVFGPKYTVLFQATHKLLGIYNRLSDTERLSLADKRLDYIRSVCSTVSGYVVCLNYPEIEDTVFGSFSNKMESSFTYQLRKLNFELMNLSRGIPNLFVCDISAIQNKFGRDFMYAPAVYVSTDMVLSIDVLPYIASRISDVIFSIEGRFRKCLILDLDNTLWGGVTGDDGWENLQIGHGLGVGEAFTEFQEWILKLRQRGIIICICSKNDDHTAREVFEKNPEMVLKMDDISVFIANWKNKDENIRTIREILNIGFDSMVFIDDNPFERNLVRENIPDICVPELPEDPAQYLEYLYSLNLFETASYSSTDSDRTSFYQADARRTLSSVEFSSADDFLRSLDMESEVSGFNRYNTPRVAQLTQRSNQFNLRTVRYTEDQIRDIGENPLYRGFAFSLRDRFGDNGLISVVILQIMDVDDRTVFIDTWLMSCRVLKRGMEFFTLDVIVSWMLKNGYRQLIGEYLPTKKNGMVAGFYRELGFKALDGEGHRWTLDVDDYQPKTFYIKCAGDDI